MKQFFINLWAKFYEFIYNYPCPLTNDFHTRLGLMKGLYESYNSDDIKSDYECKFVVLKKIVKHEKDVRECLIMLREII